MDSHVEINKDIFEKKILSIFKNGHSDKNMLIDSYLLDDATDTYNIKDGLETDVIDKIISILRFNGFLPFDTLKEISQEFRNRPKNVRLVFAHNGTGKTRLSGDFKKLGQEGENSDTLYFNAFTEDLFHWDNDLENDTTRVLQLKESKFFKVLEGEGFDMENRVKAILNRYATFSFSIDTTTKKVSFSREIMQDGTKQMIENIKVSRGEESIFIWSFFLAVAQLAIDNHVDYTWVKYIYIDDPISSLDDNNVIIVASHLAKLIKDSTNKKFIISTHHGLFYNVIFNELKSAEKFLLIKDSKNDNYKLEKLSKDTPYYQHIGILKDLQAIALSDNIYTYHFNLLRNILEKTAAFHGYDKFSDCIKVEADEQGLDEEERTIHTRRINILSHGNYSIFEPQVMNDENKEHFRKVLNNFIDEYQFNDKLFQVEG